MRLVDQLTPAVHVWLAKGPKPLPRSPFRYLPGIDVGVPCGFPLRRTGESPVVFASTGPGAAFTIAGCKPWAPSPLHMRVTPRGPEKHKRATNRWRSRFGNQDFTDPGKADCQTKKQTTRGAKVINRKRRDKNKGANRPGLRGAPRPQGARTPFLIQQQQLLAGPARESEPFASLVREDGPEYLLEVSVNNGEALRPR